MQRHRFEALWQDRDIRFDAPAPELVLRSGEKAVECFGRVEDTKGNTGEVGKLTVTNLRLVWQSLSKPRINLSIGLGCVCSLTNRMIHSKLRGRHESLYLMTKVSGTRYEFIFVCLEPADGTGRLVELVARVCKAYVHSKLFRDLRLRSAIMSADQKQLRMLPREQIYNVVNGVWNLSSDQGNLGTMYLTNIRVVWHANINELFNISLPYVQIRNIKVRDSKFGLALVIESSESSGGYVLGFRLDPVDRLNAVFEELNNIFQVHAANPDLGVHNALTMLGLDTATSGAGHDVFDVDEPSGSLASGAPGVAAAALGNYQEVAVPTTAEDLAGGASGGSSSGAHDPVVAYLAEGESVEQRPHQCSYEPWLGLSIERIKEGFTIESLWEVVETK